MSLNDAIALLGLGAPRSGLGANGSALTVAAAKALDDALVTNGCATCSDLAGPLRKLTFAFKAAVLTDPSGIQIPEPLNMSTPLAMTAFGPGTDKALTYVLGADRNYDGGPCTDRDGNCLGFAIWSPPAAAEPAIDSFMTAIRGALTMIEKAGQDPKLWASLQTLVGQGLAQLSTMIPAPTKEPTKEEPVPVPTKEKGDIMPEEPSAQPAQSAIQPAQQTTPWLKYGVIGLLGVAAMGAIYFLATSSSRRSHAAAEGRRRRRRRYASEVPGKIVRSKRYGTFVTGSPNYGKYPRGRGRGKTVATFDD
jgi:hypothetical protein